MAWLRGIIENPEKRAVLSWIAGGAIVAVGGIFTAVTHYVEHKDAHKEPSAQLQEALTGQLTAKDGQIKELMKQIAALTEKLLKENPSTARRVRSRRSKRRCNRLRKARKKAILV